MDITLPDVSIEYGGNVLIESSELVLLTGKRYGFIGPSGTGKSSLLRKMASGELEGWPEGFNTVLVPQDIGISDKLFSDGSTPLECAKRSTIPGDGENPERDMKRRDEKALKMLKSMGFGEARRSQAFTTLSQGWRQRLAIVCAALREPEALLLDEPSDAVDLPGIVRIERFLEETSDDRITVIVSHDETFLSNIATAIIHFNDRKLKIFPRDYSTFLEKQAEKERAMEARVDAAGRQKAAADAFIRKQQGTLDSNKQKQAKEKREKMDRIGNFREDGKNYKTCSLKKLGMEWDLRPDKPPEELAKPKELHFSLPGDFESLRVGADVPLVRYDQVKIGYAESVILSNVTVQITRSSRIALVGANSSGKTTLMNAICGKELVHVQGGSSSTLTGLRVAYVPQRAGESINSESGDLTPVELLTKDSAFTTEKDARQHLGRFGLSGSLGVTRISLLSGGQRTRLAIAVACSKFIPHLLILDEPSHGLDAAAKRALAEALRGFPGALLISSHDRDFLKAVRLNELWVTSKGALKRIAARKEETEEGQLEAFKETFDDYLDTL